MIKIKGSVLADFSLLIVAVIWGGGFIATQYAIDAGMSTSLIMTLRFLIAAITVFIFFFKDIIKSAKREIFHGVIAGIFLFIGFYAQTIGQSMTTVSNSAFITATNVVMIPFIVWIATKKRPDNKSFFLTATTLLGIALLTLSFSQTSGRYGLGNMIVLLSALCFAMQVSYIGLKCSALNSKVITFWQLAVSAALSLIAFLTLGGIGEVTAAQLSKGLFPTLFLGLFSTCLCYLIQTKAQTKTSPAKVGVILSMECLFGSLFSVLLRLEPLKINLILGGIIIIISVVLMSVDIKIFVRRNAD